MLRRVRARGLRSPGANREPLVDRVPGKLGPQVSNPRIWCQFTENPTSQALRWRGIAEVRAVTMAAQHFGTLPKTTVSKRKRLLADFSLGQEVASESRHQTAPHPLPRFDCAIGANAGKGCFRTPGSRLSNRCPCDPGKGWKLAARSTPPGDPQPMASLWRSRFPHNRSWRCTRCRWFTAA